MPRVKRKTKAEDLKRVRDNQRRHRQRRRDYVAELESKIASYAEAAVQADMRFQALEEKLRRENEALRTLLTSSGLDPNVLEHDITDECRQGPLDEMQTSLRLAADTVPSALEPYRGPKPLQLPNLIPSSGFPAAISGIGGTGSPSLLSQEFPLLTSAGFTTFVDFPMPNSYIPDLLERESEPHLLDFLPLSNPSMMADITTEILDAVLQDTTLCTVAIQIVCHCNKRGLNMLELDAKLRYGYRDAKSPLEGCRVDNCVLLSVITEIMQ